MSARGRTGLFLGAGLVLGTVLLIGFAHLPDFGHYHGVYGLLIAATEPRLRHATDLVTALNFDIRAFDTLGEEFILFGSVAGVALLLRDLRGDGEVERSGDASRHRFGAASSLLRRAALVLLVLLTALGGYVVVHGQLTPGGGFQGGVALAAGPLITLLAGRYAALRRLAPDWALEAIEAVGGGAYALIGLGGVIFSTSYLANFLPLGTQGKLLSSGTIPLNSLAVGVEVSGAFLLMWSEFLDQALIVRERAR